MNKVSAYELPNNNLIPAHSPFGNQFGVGIKTNELGPRRERAQRFAPFNNQLKISIKEKKDKRGIQIEHIMVGIDAASAFAICFVIWFTGRFKLV